MAKLKTQRTDASVEGFLETVRDEGRRRECKTLLGILKRATGTEPRMWGSSIVGFATYHYRYPSGREGDWFVAGFSPRKQALTLYVMAGFARYGSLLQRLGKFKTGKACLYVKRLADVDLAVLEELVSASAKQVKETHG